MDTKDIKARIGTKVTCTEAADMIRSMPLCSTEGDVKVRSGTLSFSFGPRGLQLIDMEDRPPETIIERKP